MTYVFGSLGAIIVCVNILPKFMGQSLREASIEAEKSLGGTAAAGPGQFSALPVLVGRAYRVTSARRDARSAQVETAEADMITIERIRRAGKVLEPGPDVMLRPTISCSSSAAAR